MDGPWVPGRNARFEWAEEGNPYEQRIRESVQDGGKHLYVLRLPFVVGGSPIWVLAEAYYPSEAQAGTWFMIDARQRLDWKDGRPVVISTVPLAGTFKVGGDAQGSVHGFFQLNDVMIEELCRNNRNSKQDLRRRTSVAARHEEITDHLSAAEEQKIRDSGWEDAFVAAHEDTQNFALGKPRSSGYPGAG